MGLQRQGLLVVDVPRLDWLYDDYPDKLLQSLYGRGFSYGKGLPTSFEYNHGYDIKVLRKQWRERLMDHFFDHVVFPTNGMYFPFEWYPICADTERIERKSLLAQLIEDMITARYIPQDMSLVYGEDRPLRISFYM